MAGSMYRRGDVWVLRVYVGRDPLTGKKQWRSRSVPGTRREAERALAALVTELAAGIPPRATGRTVGELFEKWYEARSPDWSPSTARETRWIIDRRLGGLRDRRVRDLGVEDLDTFYAALRQRGGQGGRPLAVSSVARAHTVLRSALAQGVRWGWRADNPAELARPGDHEPAEIRPPAPEAVAALFEAAVDKDLELLVFIALEAETGARRGELAALRLTDFGTASVTIQRALVIGPDTAENRRRYAGHCWPASWQRGDPTLLIEKPRPKTGRSVRTIALSASTAALVADLYQRHADTALQVGVTLVPDAFLFLAEPDGTKPLRADTWSHRFIRLRGTSCPDRRPTWRPPSCWRASPAGQPPPAGGRRRRGRSRAPAALMREAAEKVDGIEAVHRRLDDEVDGSAGDDLAAPEGEGGQLAAVHQLVDEVVGDPQRLRRLGDRQDQAAGRRRRCGGRRGLSRRRAGVGPDAGPRPARDGRQ
ncbi:MAG TPA: hypothetical protein VFO65_00210 [Acidimicrobiales bacterium]|nr:hypothetical protein [Acidimicrobiales bacterium]